MPASAGFGGVLLDAAHLVQGFVSFAPPSFFTSLVFRLIICLLSLLLLPLFVFLLFLLLPLLASDGFVCKFL